MSDYYEPTQRIVLARPIVIGGQLGCGSRLIGRSLSARTGLPFVEVDRQIEHEAGGSLARIAEEEGAPRIARRARSVLERLSLQRPWSVIVLDHAWPSLESTYLLRRKLDFVHVARPARFLQDRLTKELDFTSRWLLDEPNDWLDGEIDYSALEENRAPLLTEARILLDAGEQHEHVIAGLLLDSVESLADARVF